MSAGPALHVRRMVADEAAHCWVTRVVTTWGSTEAERRRSFACDRHLPDHDAALFRAVDVAAPAPILFRWLCQLRAAPYSYDWIDNFGRRSPCELTHGLDALAVGQRVMTIFTLVDFETDRHLTLLMPNSPVFGAVAVTYQIVPVDGRRCRLVVKLLVRHPRALVPRLLGRALLPAGDLFMMRKQLLTLKELAERDAAAHLGSHARSV